MKKNLPLLCLLLLSLQQKNFAQTNTCSTPEVFLSSFAFSYDCDSIFVNSDTTNNYGCIISAVSLHWIYMKVCVPGDAVFEIEGSDGLGSARDVDFVAYGPLVSPGECGLDSSQIADCSFSTNTLEIVRLENLVAGEYYKIAISNFTGEMAHITLVQTGDSALFDTSAICSSATGIHTDIPLSDNFSLYPNPANEVVNIEAHVQGYTVQIFGTDGTLILTQWVSGQKTTVDTHSLPNGLYQMVIRTDVISQGKTFIVER